MTPTTEALVTSASDVVHDLFWMLFDRSVLGYVAGAFSGIVFTLSTIVFLYLASFVVTRLWRAWNFCALVLETLSSAWDFYVSLIEKVSSALNSEEFEMFQHIFDKTINSIKNNDKKKQQEEHLPPWLERVEGRPGKNNAGVFRLVPHCECVDGVCENNNNFPNLPNAFDLPKPPVFRAQPYKINNLAPEFCGPWYPAPAPVLPVPPLNVNLAPVACGQAPTSAIPKEATIPKEENLGDMSPVPPELLAILTAMSKMPDAEIPEELLAQVGARLIAVHQVKAEPDTCGEQNEKEDVSEDNEVLPEPSVPVTVTSTKAEDDAGQ